MDKYFNCDVNRAMCAEYTNLASKPMFPRNPEDEQRKSEIRQHLAFEVLAAYAHDHGPEGNE